MEETYQYMSIKKNKFINIQSLDCERIVNLENIAHINFVENDLRIVFNTNYSLDISLGLGSNASKMKKKISDYIYWDFANEEEYNKGTWFLKNNEYILDNFYEHFYGFINKDAISSIKFEPKSLKIIFNLSNSISYTHKNEIKETAKFIFIEFPSQEDYNLEYSIIKNMYLK